MRPAIISGALLAFLTSFDEVVVAIFLTGSRAVTLPKKMYESVRFDTDPTITAASAVLIGLTLAVLLVCMLLQRQLGRAERTT
jgi:putative spermidine/putrescine transport system permease protein